MHIGRLVTVGLALVFLLCVTMAGCLGVKTPPISQPSAPAVFVDYHRSGGVAGFDDRLVIFDNGAAVVSTKTMNRDIVLNSTEIERITSMFEHAQFSQLQINYPAPRSSNDLVRYSISYHGKTVTLEESAYPASVQPIIDGLNQIISAAG